MTGIKPGKYVDRVVFKTEIDVEYKVPCRVCLAEFTPKNKTTNDHYFCSGYCIQLKYF